MESTGVIDVYFEKQIEIVVDDPDFIRDCGVPNSGLLVTRVPDDGIEARNAAPGAAFRVFASHRSRRTTYWRKFVH